MWERRCAPTPAMKTSFFHNIRNIKVPLSISQYPPKWYVGPQFKVLAPPWSLIDAAQKGMSKEKYTEEFRRVVLADLDPKEVYDAIIAEYGDDVTLLCFERLEAPGDFCHRRIVANWFEEHLKIVVPEWEAPPKFRSSLSW